MPDLLIWSTIFLISLITLIISADFFIKSSERVGLALGIPPFIVGVTLIAIGTSLPELITSIVAVTRSADSSVIVLGNVVGSNIANLCLVLGTVGFLARKIRLEFDVMRVDLPMLMGATLLLYFCVMDGHFSFFEGLICLAGMAFYLTYVFFLGKSGDFNDNGDEDTEKSSSFSWKEPIILLVSGAVIYLSADFNVESIVRLASLLDIQEEFIALSAVSIGTSLPELVVCIVAVRTRNAEMAIGNILGSNIFNIFAVMGIPSMFGKIEVATSIIDFSLPVMVGATILALIILQDRRLNRWEGVILLMVYLLYFGNIASQYL